MEDVRLCLICNSDIGHMRKHATSCSNGCRAKKFRSNRKNFVLVQFQVPIFCYTNLAIEAFKSNKGIDSYLTDVLVQKHG